MVIKVCGATTAWDVDVLARAEVDFVGLWHEVPGGHAELSLDRLTQLSAAAMQRPRPTPVMVTLSDDAEALLRAMSQSRLQWVQLHGYQRPATVATLARAGARVIKVLHVGAAGCPERPLLPAYERAGTEVFLLDHTEPDGRLGSTGQRIALSAAIELADQLHRPFLLAGGISPANRPYYQRVVEHPRYYGIDADSSARDPRGRLDAVRVAELCKRWHRHVEIPEETP